MALLPELKKIKHIYGEEFMKLCREQFPTILEDEGMLLRILQENFSNNSRTLVKDMENQGVLYDFADYVFAKYNQYKVREKKVEDTDKNVYELLSQAGYTLYEAITEEEIQSFKGYYEEGEELCTFDGGRLNNCVCFWAIRKDFAEFKRSDFTNPEREDKYSTSVLAIQFTKNGRCTVSIKSRYNHTVSNPDATYGNNLDSIVPGLTTAFEKYLLKYKCLELNGSTIYRFHLNGYNYAVDGRYYKYNMYANGVYYCPGNIMISADEVKVLEDPEQTILMDNFILDLKNKTLKQHMPRERIPKDDFENCFKDITKIQRTKEKKTGNTKLIINLKEAQYPIYITLDEQNNIIEYEDANLETIGNNFMKENKALRKIVLPNVKIIGNGFLNRNLFLRELIAPNLVALGDDSLAYNIVMAKVTLPNLKKLGNNFLSNNFRVTKVDMPNIEKIGHHFLVNCAKVTEIDALNLESVGHFFLAYNTELKKIDFPSLVEVGDNFLAANAQIDSAILPNLRKTGDYFLRSNQQITKIDFLNLCVVKNGFMMYNEKVEEAYLPNLESVGDAFLQRAKLLREIEAPKLKDFGKIFLNDAPQEVRNRFNKDKTKKPSLAQELLKLDIKSRIERREIDERINRLFAIRRNREVDEDDIGGR